MIWFVRMARWARHPPSQRYRTIVAVVLGLAAVMLAIEWIFGWPDALTPAPIPRTPVVN